MSVVFRQQLATSFTDSFQRANTTRGLGTDYLALCRSNVQANQILANFKIATNKCTVMQDGSGSGQGVPGVVYIPKSLINRRVNGISQYSEVVYSTHSGGSTCDAGPCVMFTGDMATQTQVGYVLMLQTAGTKLEIYRVTTAETLVVSVAYTPVSGDVWRIRVTPTAANNFLEVLVNGVVLGSATDTNAARPVQTGYPGLWVPQCQAGDSVTFSRLTCGKGA